jgi:glycosyltransferase involved in cell wall biosynthesis
MTLVSILTPVYRPDPAHLAATAAAVAGQQLPAGLAVEWIVQEDGPATAEVAELVTGAAAPAVLVRHKGNGHHLGVAATRNIALARAEGQLVQVLDQDDVLLPHALATLAPRFDDPGVHWAIGQADDLHPDGTRTSWSSALPFGLIPPGAVNDHAISHAGNWAVHCAGLMLRTPVLRALGGWTTGPGDDDVIMFAGLSEITTGYNDRTVTWLYRQHPAQIHRTQHYRDHSTAGRQAALQRVTAIRAARVQITAGPTAPTPTPRAGPAEKRGLSR